MIHYFSKYRILMRSMGRTLKGYSIIELVVVLGILAIIVPLAIRFTSETFDIADMQVQRASLQRAADDTIHQISRDLKAAQPCRSSLLDTPIISISPTVIEFSADIDKDGAADYVKYEIVDGGIVDGEESNDSLWRVTSTKPDGDHTGIGNGDSIISENERCSFSVGTNKQREQIAVFPPNTTGVFSAFLPAEGDVTTRTCRGLVSNFDQCDFTTITIKITQKSFIPDTADITVAKKIAISLGAGRP